ncbi:MAG: YebC/PmpR family DNA-binding transcriptional regulator [bacterium JZ-2024 1]
MSGHSKWANIKHRKQAADAKRGQIFSKIIRELTVAARMGGTNPELNSRLRKAMEKAKEVNMPMETVERAIKRGAGGEEGPALEEVFYEGYGPGGVALLIRALTDNRNRTGNEIKHILSRMEGTLAEKGAVAWQFEMKGHILGEITGISPDELFEFALKYGADDVQFEDSSFEIITDPKDFQTIRDALSGLSGIHIQSSDITYLPKNTVPLEGEMAERILRLVSALEDLDDVQEVYANFDISAETMLQVAAKT